MDALVWIGTGITGVGLVGLVACMLLAIKARSENLDDEALRVRLGRLVAWNLGSLGISVIGLMTVILGIFLN